jgi:3-hydroxybutyryl-CoA dehydrogenase
VSEVVLGVAGAGTMGAGIAQLGCAAGMRTLMHDPAGDALQRGSEAVQGGLSRWVKKGRTEAGAQQRLELADDLEALAPCDLVIEAAPERPQLKRELFARLSEICGERAVLATNTSSIPVTSLAHAARRPENVVGMHFFNPPALMKLLEVIRAEQTGEDALALASEVGRAMDKRVILAADGPGFLVNRCGRPFGAEALRLLQEGIAGHEEIDRICRMGGGFRMGPFELMDLVGIDVGFEVAQSFTELSFGEPRWKPSPIQARMVAAGRLGRKAGRGFYEYSREGRHRPPDPDPPAAGAGDARAATVLGTGPLADGLRRRARAAGLEPLDGPSADLVVDAGLAPPANPPGGRPLVVLCAAGSLAALGQPEAVGFHALPPLADCRLVELTKLPGTPPAAAEAAESFFAGLGFGHIWVGDAPGLVLGRIACQLVNEACFAVGEGVGGEEDVDLGTTLGLNHPRGPFAWLEAIGVEHVCTLLDALWRERREERYRPAPLLLRRAMLAGWRPPT